LNESPSDHPPQPHDPLAALRQPPFVVYTLSRVGSSVGNSMLQAILLWHVYALTGDPLSLGFLGLARFLPALGVSTVGGAVADVYNRRNVIMVAQTVPLAGGVVLAVATLGDWVTPAMIYGLVLVVGLASAFENPARLALLPSIVRPETFANAVTVSSTLQSLGMVTGGLVGGVIVVWDPGAAYIAYSAAIGWAFMMMAVLRYEQVDGVRRSVSLQTIKEGLVFVRRNQPIWGAMSLDMFAVIFGGAKGLLPVYASDILHAGGLGYGLLIASLEIGAFLMSAALVLRPPIVRTGRALVYSVVAFGLLTIGFGLSENLYLSIVLYMAIGAADQVSVVMRNVIIQLATPDALRGRVSSVNQVFIQASNQLGAMESGFVAAATSAVFAVVSGGVAAVAIAALFGWRLKGLFDYRQPRAFESQEQGTVPAAHGGLSAGEAAGSS